MDPFFGWPKSLSMKHKKPRRIARDFLRDANVNVNWRRRKTGKDGQEIIDQPTYRKLTRSFVRSGGIIIRGKEADLHLAQMGAHASYIPGMGVAFIRDDATVSDVLEEMYHAKQDRQNAYLNLPSDEAILRREIDAQEYLLGMAEKYQIPTNETNITRRNLADYQRMLRELKGEG